MKWLLLITTLFLLITSISFALEQPVREKIILQETVSAQKNTLFDEQGRTTVLVRLKEESQHPQRISAQQQRKDFVQEKKPVYTFSDKESFTLRVTKEELEELQNNPLIEEVIVGERVNKQLAKATTIIQANNAWSLTTFENNLTGQGQTICIIDTGVDYTHPDLGGCVGEGCKVLATFNAIDNTSNVTDIDGHGTHVTGIAAANGVVKGSAPGANIVAVKALSDTGSGSTIDVATGIDWCVTNAQTHNITIISMSLGTETLYNSACTGSFGGIREAINAATAQNITVLAASGNQGSATQISAPACIPGVIPIGSTTKTDVISGFSNLNSLVKLLAPGGNTGNTDGILSTIPDNSYDTISGTSMATPLAAGAFAIIQQQLLLINQTKSSQEIEALFLENAGVTLEEEGNTYGRIDLFQTILAVSPPPITNAYLLLGWQKETFNVTLNTTITAFDINHTTYRLNNGSWINQTTILIEEEGNNTIEFYSVDSAGIQETTKTVYALLDLTTPNTTLIEEPLGWQNTNVTLLFNATDNLSGTNYTTIRINETPWVNATNITVSEEGNNTVFFYSVDRAGNIEPTKNLTVLIDKTTPIIHDITINETTIRAGKNFSIRVNASDENLLNVTIIIGEEIQELLAQENLFVMNKTLVSGTYTATIRVTDKANNQALSTFNFTVYDLAKRTNQVFNNTNNTVIDERETTKTTISLRTKNNTVGNLTLLSTPQRPSTIPTNINNAVRFVTIQLSENLKEELNWSILEVYYEEEEITGLNESSLELQYYNETSQQWQTLDELSFVNNYGLDTANKRVWINTTRFSTYVLRGEEPIIPPPSPPPSTRGSSGGGGGGGGGGALVTNTPSNSSTQSVSFLSEGNPITLRFRNSLLAIQEIVFTPTQDRFSATFTLEKKPVPQDAPTSTKEYYELTYPQDLLVQDVMITYNTTILNPIFYRYSNNSWVLLEQERITNNTYRVYSEGFSRFVIAQEEIFVEEDIIVEEEQREEVIEEIIIQDSLANSSEDIKELVQDDTMQKNPLTIILVLLTLSFVLGCIFFVKKKKK